MVYMHDYLTTLLSFVLYHVYDTCDNNDSTTVNFNFLPVYSAIAWVVWAYNDTVL